MKRIIIMFLFALCVAGGLKAQESVGSIAESATQYYAAGDYAAAVEAYHLLLRAGVEDATIYFNLGNAYYEQGEIGQALLFYRRAHELSPRDWDLNANMALVRQQRLDRQGEEVFLLDGLTAFTSGMLTFDELSWLMIILWSGLFGVGLAYLVRADWHDILRGPLIALGVCVVVGLILLGSRAYTNALRPSAVVTDAVVTVMSGPSEDYLAIYRLYGAAEVRILEQRGEWVRFVLPDLRQGWMPLAALTRV